MEDALKEIWVWMGIPQVWGALLTILCLVIVYFLKKLVDLLAERHKADREMLDKQFADIAEYVKEQSVGLTKAYLLIFEGKDAVDAQGKRFCEIVEKADNDVMKPLRTYSTKLDEETRARIFSIHNILAQYYPEASEEAIAAFKRRKGDFYARIEDVQRVLRPDLILNRLGLVSRTLRERKRK